MNYTFLIYLAVVPVVIIAQIYLLVRKMSEPEKMMKPIDGGLSPEQQQTLMVYRDWLTFMNLNYVTSFQFGSLQSAVFQHGNAPRFFCFFFHKQITFSMESYQDDLTVLDTGSSNHIGLFPRPSAYAQSFPNISADVLFQRHLEAEAHLTKKFGIPWQPLTRTYQETFVAAVRYRMEYTRSVPLWPVRVLYRFAVTRHRLLNRPVSELYP